MSDDYVSQLERHRPSFYRYKVSVPGLRVALNRYPGVIIGASVVIGRHAYCIKWGRAR